MILEGNRGGVVSWSWLLWEFGRQFIFSIQKPEEFWHHKETIRGLGALSTTQDTTKQALLYITASTIGLLT